MAINISDYLNNLSSSITKNVNPFSKSGLRIGSDSDQETSSDFEMSFLSMINRSQDAYQMLENAQENDMLTVEDTDEASKLFDDLNDIMERYNNMRSSTTYPKSIQESMLEFLNGDESAYEDPSSAYQPEFTLDDIIRKVRKSL